MINEKTRITALNKTLLIRIFWITIVVLSAYYLYRALKFRFFTEGMLDTKVVWYYAHLAGALAPLILGPLQFWTWLRIKHVNVHRTLGKIYIIGSLAAGFTALYLGLTIDLPGSVVPISLVAVLWLFMTTSAWIAIRRRNIPAHRLFMIRSYTLAMVFIFLRLVGDIPQEKLFFFIESPELRDTTLEWVSWIIPLLTIEIIFAWLPSLRQNRIFQKGQN